MRSIGLLLSFTGFIVACLLIVKEYGSELPLCEVAGIFSCQKVLASKYSSIFGVPNSSLGVFLYSLLAGLFIFNKRINRGLAIIYFTAALVASLASVYLFYVSWFEIGALCPYCVLTYVLNFLHLVNAVIGLKIKNLSPEHSINLVKPLVLASSFLLVTLLVDALGVGKVSLDEALIKSSETPKSPIPEDISTTLGLDETKIILEFVDPLCPACVKWKLERAALQDKVRTVFFPLDKLCNRAVSGQIHALSCLLSKLFICAEKMGSSKKLSDFLYSDHSVWQMTEEELLKKLGDNFSTEIDCARSDETEHELREQIEIGIKLGLRGTPTVYYKGFLVDFSKIGFSQFVKSVHN